jgi:putative FmdB family regulatory protein
MPIFEYCCRNCSHRFETIVLSSHEKMPKQLCRKAAFRLQVSGIRGSSGEFKRRLRLHTADLRLSLIISLP